MKQIPNQAISQLLSAGQLTRRILGPVVALFVLGLAGIVIMTTLAARGRDDDARGASRRAAVWTLMDAMNRLGDLTLDYAQSDESFAYLRDRVDEAWAVANIGTAPHRIYVIDHVYVFDRKDSLVFASRVAPPSADEASPDVSVSEDLAHLLAAARAAGAKDPAKGVEVGPVHLHGQVHLAAAALIQPQNTARAIPPVEASVLVSSATLRRAFSAASAAPIPCRSCGSRRTRTQRRASSCSRLRAITRRGRSAT